jgi:endonuclease-3
MSAGGRRARATARRRLARITELLEQEYGVPERRLERDLIGSLVQTVLSQNTSDLNSSRAYERLREEFSAWGDVARARSSSIAAAIRSGGLANTKAVRIREMLRSIEREKGDLDLGFLRGVPTAEVLRYLTAFKGVGPKTAACVALFALGREVVPVDTHVHRVVGRLGVVGRPRSPEATFDALSGLAPDGKALSLHVNLIRLGRNRCRPRTPLCDGCPVRRSCACGRRSRKRP